VHLAEPANLPHVIYIEHLRAGQARRRAGVGISYSFLLVFFFEKLTL
jgi:hypothetical protein